MRERWGRGLPGCDLDSTHSAKDAEWMGHPATFDIQLR